MTTKRSDIHRPSLLDPAEYSYLGCFYQGTSEDMAMAYRLDETELNKNIERSGATPFDGNHAAKLTCDHCGANFAHGAVFLHKPTNSYITVGHICAHDTIGLPSKAAAAKKRAEKAAAAARERERALAATAGWRADHADLVAFLKSVEQAETAYRDADKDNGTYVRASHPFLLDMVHALNRYGSLTERQTAATEKFAAKAAEFAARDAQRAAEAATEPEPGVFPNGRVTVTGEIVSTKMQDSDYGSTLKMLVKLTDGNKVWGTVPASIEDEVGYDNLRGTTITFTAAFEVSKNDEHFGFFKRPTKVQVAA